MPREKQRRGRANKNKDSGISMSKDDIKREIIANRPKPALPEPEPELEEQAQQDFAPDGDEDKGDGWPELDHDSRAYWKQIEARILELEGVGAMQEDKEDDSEEDERKLLLRAALQNLAGQELALATDVEASIILERLLHSMDDFAKRVLAEAFAGRYPELARHQYASHVLQTLFVLAGNAVDREQRGIHQSVSSLRDPDSDASVTPSHPDENLPSMSTLLNRAINDLIPASTELMYHIYGTHIIRSSLLLLSGKPLATNGDRMRSKKSKAWKGSVAPMKNLLESVEGKGAHEERKNVPQEFRDTLSALRRALDVGLGKGQSATLVRDAAIQPISCIPVQILLQLEADAGDSTTSGSIADRLTGGLFSGTSEQGSDYLDACLRESTASHTFETLLSIATPDVFNRLWTTHIKGKVSKLSTHPVANFVLAKAIDKMQDEGLLGGVLEEMKSSDAVGAMIENWRTGPLKALLDRCSHLSVLGGELVQLLLSGLKLDEDKRALLVPCVLSMTTYPMYTKTPAFGKPEKPNEPALQGALLLQSWLHLPAPHSSAVIDSLISIPLDMLMVFSSNAVASHVVDAALDSPSVQPKDRRRLLMHFVGSYHKLADDRLGSRVADHCWAAADVYLKDKIAESLLEHQFSLTSSQFGRYFVRKLQLPLHQRRHDEWKQQMALQARQTQSQLKRGQTAEKRKQRDEIDDLFEGPARGSAGKPKKAKTTALA